jgi:hypothetical protein
MFQTIMKLYNTQANNKGKYIYFGGSIIFCDDKNVCSVYYDTLDNKELPSANITTVVSSI